MKTPHKFAALIKAWADGAVIEWRVGEKEPWRDTNGNQPGWCIQHQYRIKPEPTPDITYYMVYEKENTPKVYWCKQTLTHAPDCRQLKLVFDGETGEFKEAVKV
jgi:hypothetical protein